MRRQQDETLRGWANQIASRVRRGHKHQVNLIDHGAPGTETSSSAHADDEDNTHLMEFEDVTSEDLDCLRGFLQDDGVANVVVKQHSPVLGTAIVADGRTEGEEAD
jgi:hypothetical protein